MTTVALPALDGRTPLGFLAALGTLRLLSEHTAAEATLAWSTTDCTASLGGPWSTIDEVAAELLAVVDSIPFNGVLPELPTDLPPPGGAPDRMRLPRPQLRQLADSVRAAAGDDGERWMASLVTDLSLDRQGRAAVSLFAAPAGQQSMRSMFRESLLFIRQDRDVLRDALLRWRRYAGVTGEYLDHRVVYDATDAADGKPANRGVPGATWLALMAYPLLLTTAGPGGQPLSTGWHYPSDREVDRRLVYPLWSRPTDIHAAMALLRHPILSNTRPGAPPAAARALSIFQVCGASRRTLPGGKSAGLLMPLSQSLSERRV